MNLREYKERHAELIGQTLDCLDALKSKLLTLAALPLPEPEEWGKQERDPTVPGNDNWGNAR